MKGCKKQHRTRRGAAAMELAVVLPLLILVALACVDYGRYAYYSIAVTNAARAGAEYGIMNPYATSGQAAWTAAVAQAAADEMTNQTGFNAAALGVSSSVTFEKSTGLPIISVSTSYTGFKNVINWPGVPQNPTLSALVVIRGIR
jgi:Flp pilus assembly protein TadG